MKQLISNEWLKNKIESEQEENIEAGLMEELTDKEKILKLTEALSWLVYMYEADCEEPIINRPEWLKEALKINKR